MDALFSSLATERSGPRGPDDPPCIALGTLYGVLRLGLRLLPEVYAMPTQNMSFLRPIPKASTASLPTLWHPCVPRPCARARVCGCVCAAESAWASSSCAFGCHPQKGSPPLGAVFITRPHDLCPILGQWMEPPMTKVVSDCQFAMAVELVLFTADTDVFSRFITSARQVEDEADVPEQDPVVVLGGAGSGLLSAPSSNSLLPGQHGATDVLIDGRGSGAGSAYAATESSQAADGYEERKGHLWSPSNRPRTTDDDDVETFKRLVPGGAKSLHTMAAPSPAPLVDNDDGEQSSGDGEQSSGGGDAEMAAAHD